jgi:hypothetical protein
MIEKLKKDFQNFAGWYKAPIRQVERLLWLLFKLHEMEPPLRWKFERNLRWLICRLLKVLYSFLLFVPFVAIGYCIYVFAWFWPIFFGELLKFLLETIVSQNPDLI